MEIREETAAVVRRIFEMYISGMNCCNIAKQLSGEGILPPLKMNELNGRKENKEIKNKDYWKSQSVSAILRNEVYTGVMITNRYEKKYSDKHPKLRDKEEWFYFPERHEAIISSEMFEKAQNRMPKISSRVVSAVNEKISMLYCGHCGSRFTRTTRMGGLWMCRDASQMPGAECGEIQIREEVLKKIIVEMINMEAKLLLNWAELEKNRLSETKEIEKQIQKIGKRRESYRQKRIELYEMYRGKRLDKDSFIEKKLYCMKQEEDCMEELERLNDTLYGIQMRLKKLDAQEAELRDGVYLEAYESDTVNRLVEKIEIFNDERIKIHWRFESEFPECVKKEDVQKDTKRPDNMSGKAAVYTADLFFEKPEKDIRKQAESLVEYCERNLHLSRKDIMEFSDASDPNALFYMADYMKLLARARKGEFSYIVIRSFADLYLPKSDLYNLLYWVLPKLPCRFISVQDEYDSLKVEAEKQMQFKEDIYKKYYTVRRSDIMKQRATEIKSGKRKPMRRKETTCVKTYGYYQSETGFIEDKEITEVVTEIFKQAFSGVELYKIARSLNQRKIPTLSMFWEQHGYRVPEEKNKKWTGEKVWQILRNDKYIGKCRYKEICQERGQHCELNCLISEEEYQYVAEHCQYRKSRW